MLKNADLERIEGGEYTERDVRELVDEVRYLRKLNLGLVAECQYWSGAVQRSSSRLYLECIRVLQKLRQQYG